jgi:hypothetical protein
MNNSLKQLIYIQIIFELLHNHKLAWITTNNQCFYTPSTYDNFTSLSSHEMFISLGVEYIVLSSM